MGPLTVQRFGVLENKIQRSKNLTPPSKHKRAAVKKIALRIQKDRPRYSIGLKWLSSCESRLFFLFFDWIKWTIFVKLIWNHEKTPTSTTKPAKSCKSRLRRIFCLIYQWDFAFRNKFTQLRMAPIFEDWKQKIVLARAIFLTAARWQHGVPDIFFASHLQN